MQAYDFFVSGLVFTIFFTECGRGCSRSVILLIFAMSIHSGSRVISQNALNFWPIFEFLLFKIVGGPLLPMLVA